jgi:hypothetical protein
LVAHHLAMQLSGFESRHLLNIQNGDISIVVANTISPQKNIKKIDILETTYLRM